MSGRYSTHPVESSKGTRKPINWPKGLTLGFRPIFDGQIMRIYFLCARTGISETRAIYFYKSTYKEKRLEALNHLAKLNGFKKIPDPWLESVAATHQGFLKQCFMICEMKPVCHYQYKNP